jgi:hypothetical protein
MLHRSLIGLLSFFILFSTVSAQDSVTAPDLTGFTVPEAAAMLNRVGLALGVRNSLGWTEASGLPVNTIISQGSAPGIAVTVGSAVDVTVLRAMNVALIYDENDFTIQNRSGVDVGFGGLIFSALDGPGASFAATRWSGGLGANRCAQVWSISRSQPKDIEGCERISNWLVTGNTAEHFWTGLTGATYFSVTLSGAELTRCPTAPAGSAMMRCDLYLPLPGGDEVTAYVYFAYTPDRLIVFNRSRNQWMPLGNTVLYNFNPNLGQPGAPISLGNVSLYNSLSPVADVTLLAPGQCVLFTNNQGLEALNLPEACDVIGSLNIDPALIFWSSDFQLDSITDGQRRTCNAATASRLTLCIMPR